MKIRTLLLAVTVAVVVFPQAANAEVKGARILFVGNSITVHPPVPEIGSTGSWGMAATAAEKDYVHLVVGALAKNRGTKPEFPAVNLAAFERGYEGFDFVTALEKEAAFNANTVIVALGENAPALTSDETKAKFREAMVRLLTFLRRNDATAVYVRSCFWPDLAKDAALKQACEQVGGTFIDISALSKDERNHARSELSLIHI